MSLRTPAARAVSAVSTWGLRHVAHRPAASLPGKLAYRIDPNIIAHSRGKLRCGSIITVGTNGKTTINNMIADAVEQQGLSISCNRTGANLAFGVASALLQTKGTVDWGVFESDELWLGRTLPQVQATYVLLLNLFRDQLDRCGEIDRVQDTIVAALEASPETTLLYNADDPLCAMVASRVSNKKIAFGVGEDLHQEQNTVTDAQMCQRCSGMFEYGYRQYGQLGTYRCPSCGFERPKLDFAAVNVKFGRDISFEVEDTATGARVALRGQRAGAYMVYNVMAAWLGSHLLGVEDGVFQKAVDNFDPQNGRLQHLTIEGRKVLLNLAKNPTGFNQNMKLITQAEGKKAAAFFINDFAVDGHDISWIWDCDFEELADQDHVVVYAGGVRKNDLQMRLKYAGINARLIDSVNDMVDDVLAMPGDWDMYAIANYTALPQVRADLVARADKQPVSIATVGENEPVPFAGWALDEADASSLSGEAASALAALQEKPLRIVHAFPDLLNLYGDGGNVRVLERRCTWRGIPAVIDSVHYGEPVDFNTADIVFLGGGPDREQTLASDALLALRDNLAGYIEADGVLLAICGGYQILGKRWLSSEGEVPGLSVLDIDTVRAGEGFDRLIDNIVLSSPLATLPVVGYENHAGRTHLAEGVKPFGSVISEVGKGNNDTSGADGALYRNCVATYLHGPLLGKNPEVADWLIGAALGRRYGAEVASQLMRPLDDVIEKAANAYMVQRLGVNG